MATTARSRRLEKALGLPYAYAIATGVTLSSGFFLLPGLAYEQAGPAVVLAYLLAAFPLLPGVFSKAELATAMPRAGGEYFFLDRAVGPLFGTVAGLGTWLALVLKTAFALVGMGAYLEVFLPSVPLVGVAVVTAVLLGVLNWVGAGTTGALQVVLVAILLVALAAFSGDGLLHVELTHFEGFLGRGWDAVWGTTGMVCVGYVGITKVASVSEEIKRPESTIPKAMFLAMATAVLVYVIGTFVMVGVLPGEALGASLTPVADTAAVLAGRWGALVMSVAAVLAFVSVANAGVLSASRYPLAMSRDRLLPHVLKRLGKRSTPALSIALTVALVVACVTILDPTGIAKLASAFQLLLFASNCVAVLVMRESRIASYDPSYRTPLYPWLPLAGVAAPVWLVGQMGRMAVTFCLAVGAVGAVWYLLYGRRRVVRTGAVYHVFERWGRWRDEGLDAELRGIMKEKGAREEDPFDEVVARAEVLDLAAPVSFEDVVAMAAGRFAARTPCSAEALAREFLAGTRVGATPVARGTALPHARLAGLRAPELVLVRSGEGLRRDERGEVWGAHPPAQPIYAIFFVVSPEEEPTQHLRLLAHLAARADDEAFMQEWLAAGDEHDLKELLLRDERFHVLVLDPGTRAAELIGQRLRELRLPRGCLIAVIRRDDRAIVPDGDTVLRERDRVTIIGETRGVRLLAQRFGES